VSEKPETPHEAPMLAIPPVPLALSPFNWFVQRVPAGTPTASGPLREDSIVYVITTPFGAQGCIYTVDEARALAAGIESACNNIVTPSQQDIVNALASKRRRD